MKAGTVKPPGRPSSAASSVVLAAATISSPSLCRHPARQASDDFPVLQFACWQSVCPTAGERGTVRSRYASRASCAMFRWAAAQLGAIECSVFR